MVADDTNLLFSNKDINTVFLKVIEEKQKINEWFVSNQFSLNVKKNQTLVFPRDLEGRKMRIAQIYVCVLLYFLL